MRAGAAVAVKFVGAFLERIHHLAKGAVDVLTRKRLEHDVLEAEIDGKIDVAAILSAVSESPVVVQIAKRPVYVMHVDGCGAILDHLP